MSAVVMDDALPGGRMSLEAMADIEHMAADAPVLIERVTTIATTTKRE